VSLLSRDYDAQTSRWASKDPVKLDGGTNLYRYVQGDPVNLLDSNGLWPDWVDRAKRNRQKTTYDGHREQRPKDHKDIFNPTKKRNKQKREKKQLNDICKEYDITDRDDFGDYLEEWKPDNGYSGGDTLPYEVLRDVAKEYKGF
jgi:uncharacterized protein RhaS with RHS repeats